MVVLVGNIGVSKCSESSRQQVGSSVLLSTRDTLQGRPEKHSPFPHTRPHIRTCVTTVSKVLCMHIRACFVCAVWRTAWLTLAKLPAYARKSTCNSTLLSL